MESESLTNHTAILVRSSERYTILNGLRGLVLPGIALTDFPAFSLYSLLPIETTSAMPTAGVWTVQALFREIWPHYCQSGPLEWIWRMFTYEKVFKLIKEQNG